MGLRDEKKAAMRAAIIETTLALFRTLGFNRARGAGRHTTAAHQ